MKAKLPLSTTFSMVGVAAAALTLAACGDDEPGVGSLPPAATTPPTSVASESDGTTIEYPTGADDVVVSIRYEGGFVPPEVLFVNVPSLMVSGDGRVFTPGAVPAVYPGPLLPFVEVRDIDPTGIQEILGLAGEHGLFTEREYVGNDMIADAPNTVVTISANGVTYTHSAYALGFDSETDPDRMALAEFVSHVSAEFGAGSANPALGDAVGFESEQFLMRATPVADPDAFEVEPTIQTWPQETGVALAQASECVAIDAAEVANLFAIANQLSFFVDGEVTYSLAVKPQLPGDGC